MTADMHGQRLDYLVVDDYLHGFHESAALHAAFTSGLIDHLASAGASIPARNLGGKRAGVEALLRHNNVIESADGRVRLTPGFRRALAYRDLLETKLHFSMLLARGLAGAPEQMLHIGPRRSHETPDYLRLFAYDASRSSDLAKQTATRDWVRFMTVLTKYESQVAVTRHDFRRHRRMVDVGGNSGEFSHVVAASAPDLEAIVYDLPGVIDLGQEWNRDRPTADRVHYMAGDARVDPLPTGCDLVTFKGVLHDWPNPIAETFVSRAWAALEPGGTFLIFERSRLGDDDIRPMAFGSSTMSFWGWIFQGPDRYVRQLESLGATDIEVETFHLDLPWLLLTAIKP